MPYALNLGKKPMLHCNMIDKPGVRRERCDNQALSDLLRPAQVCGQFTENIASTGRLK
jgi:hypothetical protein